MKQPELWRTFISALPLVRRVGLLALVVGFLAGCNLVSGKITGEYGTQPQIQIESSSLGTGSVFDSITINTTESVALYAIKRDKKGSYLANSAVTWGLTGGIGSLLVNGEGKSATFNAGAIAGTNTLTISENGVIRQTISITVVGGADPDPYLDLLSTLSDGDVYTNIGNLTVQLKNPDGSINATATDSVTLTITSDPDGHGARFMNNGLTSLTANAVAGQVTFANLVFDEPSAGLEITATVTGYDSAAETVNVTGARKIYRSIAVNATAPHAISGGTQLTISGTRALFSAAVEDNVGVGDVLQYDSAGGGDGSGAGPINAAAIITHRISSTEFVVKTSGLGTPAATVTDQDWSICRAYTTLANAQSGTENVVCLDNSIEDFEVHAGGYDLSTNKMQWSLAIYNSDGTADSSSPTLTGWTTSENYYLKIYTPIAINEVGVSQRHKGLFDSTLARFRSVNQSALTIDAVHFVEIEGLVFTGEFDSSLGYALLSMQNLLVPPASSNARIIGSLFRLESTSTPVANVVSSISGTNINAISNNMFSDQSTSGTNTRCANTTDLKLLYNNTCIDFYDGFNNSGTNTVAKNNLVMTRPGNGHFTTNFDTVNSEFNAVNNASTNLSNNAVLSVAPQFVDANYADYRIKLSDTFVYGKGIDLSADSLFPMAADIRGQARSVWTIGAYEGFDGSALANWNSEGNGTSEFPYKIHNKVQIGDLGVNGCGLTFALGCSDKFSITGDIDLTGESWAPIGSPANRFTGQINGNGSVISDLTFSDSGRDAVGFIGQGNTGCLVENLILDDVDIQGKNQVGAVVGIDCSLQNVTVADGEVSGTSNVGGLVGRNNGFTLTDVLNKADISSAGSFIGGVIGTHDGGACTRCGNYGAVNGDGSVGGVAGSASAFGAITESYSKGYITGAWQNVGGLVGQILGARSISNSFSTGVVRCDGPYVGGLVGQHNAIGGISESWSAADVHGTSQVGGLVGYIDNTPTGDVVVDSSAFGDVRGTDVEVAGLIGRSDSAQKILRSYAHGDVHSPVNTTVAYVAGLVGQNSGPIENSGAYGNVSAPDGNRVGGLVGRNMGTIDKSFAQGRVMGGKETGGLVGMTGATVTESFFQGTVYGRGVNGTDVGGFAGRVVGAVANSYAVADVYGDTEVGGFAGETVTGGINHSYAVAKVNANAGGYAFVHTITGGTFTNNFWDNEVETLNGSSAAPSVANEYEGKTSGDLRSPSTFSTYDTTNVWTILGGAQMRPIHLWSPEGTCQANPEITDYDALGRDGSPGSPYLICNASQLVDFALNGCGNSNFDDCDKYIQLGRDIDLAGLTDVEIGDRTVDQCFSGVFDGRNKKIFNFSVAPSAEYEDSLFSCLSGHIRNLVFENSYFDPHVRTALLISDLRAGSVVNTHISGAMSAVGVYTYESGMFTGYVNEDHGVIAKSTYSGELEVSGANAIIGSFLGRSYPYEFSMQGNTSIVKLTGTGGRVGGLAGTMAFSNTASAIERSRSFLQASGVGGEISGLADDNAYARESYVHMDVTGGDSISGLSTAFGHGENNYSWAKNLSGSGGVSGLIGDGNYGVIKQCYAQSNNLAGTTVHGIANGTIGSPSVNNFWDSTASGLSTGSSPGKWDPLTSAEMDNAANFTNWDFVNTWFVGEDTRSPRLRWAYDPICADNATALNYNDIGAGTASDPYRICFKEQLLDIGANCNASVSTSCDYDYLLMNDIDLTGEIWNPIGSSTPTFNFVGTIDGGNHTISNLKVTAGNEVGFIGYADHADFQLKNLKLVSVDISSTGADAGGVCGSCRNGAINNVNVSGKVSATVATSNIGGAFGHALQIRINNVYAHVDVIGGGSSEVGGFIGLADQSANIRNSYSLGNVSGGNVSVGGFVGLNKGKVVGCFATGSVNGSTDVGGFVGGADGSGGFEGIITYSYATGDVTGTTNVGGFAGRFAGDYLRNNYSTSLVTAATPGGFIGQADAGAGPIQYNYFAGTIAASGTAHGFVKDDSAPAYTSNFWNSTTTGLSADDSPSNYEPKDASEMQTNATFTGAGWDMDDKFINDPNGGGPQLRRFSR